MRATLANLSHAALKRHLLVPVLAASLGAASLTSGLASAQETTVQSILQIEQVKPRLAATPSLIEKTAEVAKADGIMSVSELRPLLEKAAASAFNSVEFEASISNALAKSGRVETDPSALTKAAQALAAVQEKLKDSAADNRPKPDPADAPKIAALTEAMASPQLAAETAFTQQVMYVALEALTNSGAAKLAAMPMQDLPGQMKSLVKQLRERNSNEKPLPRDVAQALEKNRLTLILSALPREDLQVLSDFYSSAGGKAKRDALVSAYHNASEAANTQFLENYFLLLVEHIKSNPSQWQN